MEIRRIEPADRAALEAFLDSIPDADRTFLKEDVADPDVVAAWARPGDARAIAVEDDAVLGYVAVIPLHGWSSHVGDDVDQEPLIAMFRALGLEPEALLVDHVRDRSGALRDLLVLAHAVDREWAAMTATGIVEAL